MGKHTTIGLIAAAIAMASSAIDAQQMYRWVDKDGKVHYSDKKPPESQKDMQNRNLTGNVVTGGTTDFGLERAAKNFPVTLYTAENCQTPCQQAREALAKRGVPFNEIAVKDEKQREELKAISGELQVPVLKIGKEVKRGYESGMYQAALDAAGYPESVAPGAAKAAAAKMNAAAKADEAKPEAPAAPKGRYAP